MALVGSSGLAWKGASLLTEALRAFKVSDGSADRDLYTDRENLVYRSRALFQNNLFCSALVRSMDVNVVGSGIKARPIPDHELLKMDRETLENWSRIVQKHFDNWADNQSCDVEGKNDFYQLQDLGLKTQVIAGECFGLPQYDSSNPYGILLKTLESDRCRTPFGRVENNTLCMGVETTRQGRPIGYYFTKTVPNGVNDYSEIYDTVFIEAFDPLGARNVIHSFITERSDQRRGVPMMAQMILQMKQLDRYQDSELMAAVVASRFTVLIQNKDENSDPLLSNVAEGEQVAKNEEDVVELAPGGIVRLNGVQDIKFANASRPNANFNPFVDYIQRGAAASMGQSSEQVMHYFNSSYNAVRAAIQEAKKTYEKIKYNFIAGFCQPVYEKFLSSCIARGIINAPGYFDDALTHMLWNSCRWDSDAGFMLDPTKETQAIIMQLDNQLIDRDTACRKICGNEYSVVAAKLAEERKLRARLELPEPGPVSKTENVSIQEEGDGQNGGQN